MKYVHFKWLDYMDWWIEDSMLVNDDITISYIKNMLEWIYKTERRRKENWVGEYKTVYEPAKVIILNIIKD